MTAKMIVRFPNQIFPCKKIGIQRMDVSHTIASNEYQRHETVTMLLFVISVLIHCDQ